MAKWNSGAGPLGLHECNEGGLNGLGSVMCIFKFSPYAGTHGSLLRAYQSLLQHTKKGRDHGLKCANTQTHTHTHALVIKHMIKLKNTTK